MNRSVTQIRDIEIIEKELTNSAAGTLAFAIGDEKVMQYSSSFIYLHKNIYIFISEGHEILDKIHFNKSAGFTVINSDTIEDNTETGEKQYRWSSISISGVIKKIEDNKIYDEILKQFYNKYSSSKSAETESLGSLLLLDTEEIQAFEETGE